jgi:hypothetical protein
MGCCVFDDDFIQLRHYHVPATQKPIIGTVASVSTFARHKHKRLSGFSSSSKFLFATIVGLPFRVLDCLIRRRRTYHCLAHKLVGARPRNWPADVLIGSVSSCGLNFAAFAVLRKRVRQC